MLPNVHIYYFREFIMLSFNIISFFHHIACFSVTFVTKHILSYYVNCPYTIIIHFVLFIKVFVLWTSDLHALNLTSTITGATSRLTFNILKSNIFLAEVNQCGSSNLYTVVCPFGYNDEPRMAHISTCDYVCLVCFSSTVTHLGTQRTESFLIARSSARMESTLSCEIKTVHACQS